MEAVSVRELRNHGGEVLNRVSRGESLIVTRDGVGVAELRPLPRPSLATSELVRRWSRLPAMDPEALPRDIDSIVDQSL